MATATVSTSAVVKRRKSAARRLTPEQCRERVNNCLRQVDSALLSFTSGEEWRRFLDTLTTFHDYSLNNCILILRQCPNATMVAGFRQWLDKGRQVRKGSKSIKIFGFAQKNKRRGSVNHKAVAMIGDTTSNDDIVRDENGEPEKVTYFPVVSVFDVSQTDPVDGVPNVLMGDSIVYDDAGLKGACASFIRSQSLPLTAEDQNLLSSLNMVKLAANIALQSCGMSPDYGLSEVATDSVAYVINRFAGVPIDDVVVPVLAKSACGDIKRVRAVADLVRKASDMLIKALELDFNECVKTSNSVELVTV